MPVVAPQKKLIIANRLVVLSVKIIIGYGSSSKENYS
jgi:hypothetical protein